MHAIAGLAVFVTVLVLVVVRPLGLSEALPAVCGAVLMVALGLVSLRGALNELAANATLFLFFLGLMVIAAIADEAGFFERVAYLAARNAGDSPRRLLVNVFIAGALITAVLSNDATALVLTPVVYVLVVRLRLEPTPYVFACTFVADAASFLLPVSNPVNVILTAGSGIQLGPFLAHLLPAELLVLAINLGLFLLLFRGDLEGRLDVSRLQAGKGDRYLPRVAVVLGCIAAGYVTAAAIGAQVAFVAAGGAAVLTITAAVSRRLEARKLARAISWPLFPFVAGMLILVKAMEGLGLTAALGDAAAKVAGGSTLVAVVAGTAGVAIGANLINNVPAALVAHSAAAGLPPTSAMRAPLTYAAILGADLGPNVSVAGSLATMLWLLILRRRGLEVSSLRYLRLGLTITPLALLAGALAIAGSLLVVPP